MSKNIKPLADWDSEQFSEPLVWWSKLDDKYQIEVHRKGERKAKLIIFDHLNDDNVLASFDVGLSYGALFGADIFDIRRWQETAGEFVDSLKK